MGKLFQSNEFRLELKSVNCWCEFWSWPFMLNKPKLIVIMVKLHWRSHSLTRCVWFQTWSSCNFRLIKCQKSGKNIDNLFNCSDQRINDRKAIVDNVQLVDVRRSGKIAKDPNTILVAAILPKINKLVRSEVHGKNCLMSRSFGSEKGVKKLSFWIHLDFLWKKYEHSSIFCFKCRFYFEI